MDTYPNGQNVAARVICRAPALAAAVLALASFFCFPGHTWLESDTLIYVPILERLWNPGLLSLDPVASRPHVLLTFYDEIANSLRGLTGAKLSTVLQAQQLLFRAFALYGVLLLAQAAGLRLRQAIPVAAILGLGAVIGGPTVLLLEYEPVPRGFAVCLVLLATGLAAAGRPAAAAWAAAVAMLYHAPAVFPFWAANLAWLAATSGSTSRFWRRVNSTLIPAGAACAAIVLRAALDGTQGTPPHFFWRTPPSLEEVLRFRSPYLFVDLWPRYTLLHHALALAAAAAALWRLRRNIPAGVICLLGTLAVLGTLSIPAAWLLQSELRWGLASALQPARACLWITAAAMIGCALAAGHAALCRRHTEAMAFYIAALAPAVQFPLPELVLGLAVSATAWAKLFTLALLAGLFTWAASPREDARWNAQGLILPVATALPFLLLPHIREGNRLSPEIRDQAAGLARWAGAATAPEAVFFFAGFGRDLTPALFRALALRPVYTDWKAGGQANFLPEFGAEWAARWAKADPDRVHEKAEYYRELGIDYVVTRRESVLSGCQEMYLLETYRICRTGRAEGSEKP